MDGLSLDKVLVILVIAVFLVGPERLPHYAQQLARLTKSLRGLANGARDRMREEMGPEFDEVDWTKLDPRQYDPRRIIRDALTESDTASTTATATTVRAAPHESAYEQRQRKLGKGRPAPFDAEAT